MAAVDIQAKIRAGLEKAVGKTGSPSSPPVSLVVRTQSGGGANPITDPPTYSESLTTLVDAIFQSYNADQIDGTTILSGDRRLVSNSDVAIKQNDIIEQAGQRYKVIDVDPVAPVSDSLVYKSQLRLI
tara:strand:+ start:109 stop:492 length:384 start_codon:yes stop_codon:yes gene_type:complete